MLLQTDSFYFVLQSRDSPFANTKTRRKREMELKGMLYYQIEYQLPIC
jgi:hypothetical protein